MATPEDLKGSLNASQIIEDTNSANSTYLYHGTPAVVTLSTLLVISMILAVVGNVMVIMTIIRHRGMRTRTNILLANLAVADILVAVLDMPVALITILTGDWLFGESFCYFNGFTVGLGLMLSVQTLMWISIHKFISITRPFSRTITPTKIVLMLVGAWSWTIFYNLTPLMGFTETVFKPGSSQCGPAIPKELRQMLHSAVNTFVNLVIPIIVMAYCYYRIFKEVRDHLNRMRDFADTNVRNSLIQQRHITQTLCIVLIFFLLFWTPYICYSLSLVFFGQEHVWPIFNPISYLCGYMNSACNPIIYALRSPSFRRGFKEIICRKMDVPPGDGYGAYSLQKLQSLSLSGGSVLRSRSAITSRQTVTDHEVVFCDREKEFLDCLTLHNFGDERFPVLPPSSSKAEKSDNSQFDRRGINTFGGIMVSFRRSLWRRTRREPRRKVKETRAREMRGQTRENGSIMYKSSLQPFLKPDDFKGKSDIVSGKCDDLLMKCDDMPADKAEPLFTNEPEANYITGEFSSSSHVEIDAKNCFVGGDSLSGMTKLTINYALCNSSPDILESLDTNKSSDIPDMEHILPLVVEPSSTNSSHQNCCHHTKDIPQHYATFAGTRTPHSSETLSARFPQNNSILSPYTCVMSNSFQNKNIPLSLLTSSNHSILNCQPIHIKGTQKSASAGDVATLQHYGPNKRPRIGRLVWQPSVDNLCESPWFSSKQKYNVRCVAARHKQQSQEILNPGVNNRSQNTNPRILRVTTIINNMKHSISDLLQGDGAEQSQISMVTSKYSSSDVKEDRQGQI